MLKKCSTCAAYCKVYTEMGFGYSSILHVFYCTRFNKIAEREIVCDNWRKRGRGEVDFSKARFDEVERDILFIKKNYKKLR